MNRPDPPEPPINWADVRAMLARRIRHQLGHCEQADLDDLVQEAVIRLLRECRRSSVRNLNGLVVVVAQRVAIDSIRRRERERGRFVQWDQWLEGIEDPLPPGRDGDDLVEAFWFLLIEFLRQRRAPCHALALCYLEKGNWSTVAEIMGRSCVAVRQQWSRCMREFRAHVESHPEPFRRWLEGRG